ncbi:putative motility protein [Paenibacillus periandrae]|uniref:putative motility protein n=1 Tax=Paenibacillus periandrae TaxID=1761741 RepID=UPI001F09F84A|nr:putative motility protein [Paenibacillus periandrae]
MDISSALAAVSTGDALRQAVGITLLGKVQDTQAAQAAVMLQDFAAAQHPNLGKTLDIRI